MLQHYDDGSRVLCFTYPGDYAGIMQTHDNPAPERRRVADLSIVHLESIAKFQEFMLRIDTTTASRQRLRVMSPALRNADFVSIRTRAAIIAMKRIMDEVIRFQDSPVCRSCGDI